jgi:hypothetical protein
VTGIFVLAMMALWLYLAAIVTRLLVKNITNRATKLLASMLLGLALFLAPVADEIIGGIQFRSLCKNNVGLNFDASSIRGKTIVSSGYKKRKIHGVAVPIKENVVSWKNNIGDQILLTETSYKAQGGWLSRSIGFNNVKAPYTFTGNCSPNIELQKLRQELGVQILYK